MAAVVGSLTFSGTDSASENIGDIATLSISPSAGAIVVIAVGANKPSTTPTQPTISGLGMTWTAYQTVTISSMRRTTFFYALANGSIGQLGISHGGQQQQNIYWGVAQVNSTDVSGGNGVNTFVQGTTNSGTNQTLYGVPLPSFGKQDNGGLGVSYINGVNTQTPLTGFTVVGDFKNSHGINMIFAPSANVGTGIGWTASGVNFTAVGVELNALSSHILSPNTKFW